MGGVGDFTITAPATPEAQQWEGWGTSLKPAHEPLVVARKPLTGTVAANVLEHGTGGLNIDGCRVEINGNDKGGWRPNCYGKDYRYDNKGDFLSEVANGAIAKQHPQGRFPANLIHDGSDEVLALFPETGASNFRPPTGKPKYTGSGADSNAMKASSTMDTTQRGHNDNGGSAARFFYSAKASKRDRNEGLEGAGEPELVTTERGVEWVATDLKNTHPTVKPTNLMRYLCRLITPPGGVILDPFMGSGSTGKAARLEGFDFIGIEKEPEYITIAEARIKAADPDPEQPSLFAQASD